MKRYYIMLIFGLAITVAGCAALDQGTAPPAPGEGTPPAHDVLDSAITDAGTALAIPTSGLSVGIAAILVGGLGLVRRIRGLNQVIKEINASGKVPPVTDIVSQEPQRILLLRYSVTKYQKDRERNGV